MVDLDDEERLADDRELSQRRKVEELQNIYSANREDEHISTDEARAALAAVDYDLDQALVSLGLPERRELPLASPLPGRSASPSYPSYPSSNPGSSASPSYPARNVVVIPAPSTAPPSRPRSPPHPPPSGTAGPSTAPPSRPLTPPHPPPSGTAGPSNTPPSRPLTPPQPPPSGTAGPSTAPPSRPLTPPQPPPSGTVGPSTAPPSRPLTPPPSSTAGPDGERRGGDGDGGGDGDDGWAVDDDDDDDDDHEEEDEEVYVLTVLEAPFATSDSVLEELVAAEPVPGSLTESVLYLVQAGIDLGEIARELRSGSVGPSPRAEEDSPYATPRTEEAAGTLGGITRLGYDRLSTDESDHDDSLTRQQRRDRGERRLAIFRQYILPTCLVLLCVGVFASCSIDFLPPLHHAVVYSWLTRTLEPATLSAPGMYWVGPFATLYLVPSTVQTLTFSADGAAAAAAASAYATALERLREQGRNVPDAAYFSLRDEFAAAANGPAATASAASASGASVPGLWVPSTAERHPLISARAASGLPIGLELSVLWSYDGPTLAHLFPHVESPRLLDESKSAVAARAAGRSTPSRTYMPAAGLLRRLATSAICDMVAHFPVHSFFTSKRAISANLTAAVRAAFAPYVRLDSLQLLRLELPAEFEEALMRTVITRLTILEAVRFQARRAVEFRTLTLASRYSAVATVILARGNASRVRQRAFGHAAMLAQTVAAELNAFANVTRNVGEVRPRDVLEYAYWQQVVREDALKATRFPLHEVLLARDK